LGPFNERKERSQNFGWGTQEVGTTISPCVPELLPQDRKEMEPSKSWPSTRAGLANKVSPPIQKEEKAQLKGRFQKDLEAQICPSKASQRPNGLKEIPRKRNTPN